MRRRGIGGEGWRKGARLKERGASRVYICGASFSLSRNNKRIACHLEFDIGLLSSMMPPPAETERVFFSRGRRELKVDFFEVAEKFFFFFLRGIFDFRITFSR